MPTVMVAAPAPAPAPKPDQHTALQSLAYHLLPGLAPTALILILWPLMDGWGLPKMMSVVIGAFFGVVPVQLGILYYLGWKRNGRLSLAGIVLYREPVPLWQVLLLGFLVCAWAGLGFTFLQKSLDGLLLPLFAWLPASLQPMSEDLATFTKGVRWLTWLTSTVGTAWLAPYVEELYFRGFLLPRMQKAGAWAPLLNALLFSLYHFFTPWQNLTRILGLIPLVYTVQWKRSIWIGIVGHGLLNTIGLMGLLAICLQ